MFQHVPIDNCACLKTGYPQMTSVMGNMMINEWDAGVHNFQANSKHLKSGFAIASLDGKRESPS